MCFFSSSGWKDLSWNSPSVSGRRRREVGPSKVRRKRNAKMEIFKLPRGRKNRHAREIGVQFYKQRVFWSKSRDLSRCLLVSVFLTHQDSSFFFYVHLIHNIRSWYSSTQLEERTKNHQNSYRQGNILLLFIKARWKFKIIITVSRIQCSWNQNNIINELLSFSTKFVVFHEAAIASPQVSSPDEGARRMMKN